MPICEICKHRKTKFFHKIDKYIYYECLNCNTLFLQPKPTLSQAKNYYAKIFKYADGEMNEIRIRSRAKLILKNLKNIYPTGKTVLDVGSGYGYFLDEAKSFGFKILGIEPSKTLYSISIKHLIEKIFLTDFSHFYARNRNKKFDFITIIHTIEHLVNPAETISQALTLLNKDGLLYIETPNLDSHLFNAEKYSYTFLTPPDHIWIFSQKSFDFILTNIPKIQIEQISTYSYPEHLMGIIKRKLKNQISNLKANNDFQVNMDSKKTISNFENWDWENNWKFIKFILFDKLFAPLFTPLLNLGAKGSILELYIRKK